MNNLVIVFDSLSAASLGCYGSNAKTPAFDKVATNGDLFTNCYSDFSGKLIEEFVEQFPIQVLSDLDSGIDSTSWNNSDSESSQSQVVRVVVELDTESADELLESLLNHFTQHGERDFNLVVTALNGIVLEEDSVKKIQTPNEVAAHVPLIVSLADQNISRRRLELMTSQHVVQILESLADSRETYERFRDSIAVKQITYSTAEVVATRTRDWLHFCENHADEHGEHSQQLFRKPEDVWEILDVSDQYPQLIEHFEATGELTFPT